MYSCSGVHREKSSFTEYKPVDQSALSSSASSSLGRLCRNVEKKAVDARGHPRPYDTDVGRSETVG